MLNRKERKSIDDRNQMYFYILITVLTIMAIVLSLLPVFFNTYEPYDMIQF